MHRCEFVGGVLYHAPGCAVRHEAGASIRAGVNPRGQGACPSRLANAKVLRENARRRGLIWGMLDGKPQLYQIPAAERKTLLERVRETRHVVHAAIPRAAGDMRYVPSLHKEGPTWKAEPRFSWNFKTLTGAKVPGWVRRAAKARSKGRVIIELD